MSLRGTGVPCMGPRYSVIELLIITITLLACDIKDKHRESRIIINTGREYVTDLLLQVHVPLSEWIKVCAPDLANHFSILHGRMKQHKFFS